MGDSCKPSGPTPQACARYVLLTFASSTWSVAKEIELGLAGNDLYYPAIAVDSGGNLMTVLTQSSSALNPKAVTGYLPQGMTTFSTLKDVATSAHPNHLPLG
jgi:hypothetical protein